MPRHLPPTIIGALLAAVFLAPPGASAAPSPGERVERAVRSTAPDRKLVRLSHVRQFEPLPASVPKHPRRCEWISYLRYRHRDGPRNPARADAVLVAMPGFLGGASSQDIVARNVVRKAAARGRHVEYWALDRRANCIEDNSGVRGGARSSRGYRLALDYYWGGEKVNGRRFRGFKTSDQLPFLAEIGLAQTMRDEYDVIRRAIPSQRLRKRKVFCGGHSLGGLLTGAFATWDFDGDPETRRDAGFNQCAGYFGLDTSVTNDTGGSRNLRPIAEIGFAAEREAIRSGAVSRFASAIPPITPEVFQAIGVLGLAAYQEPDNAGLLRRLPRTFDIDSSLQFTLSRNAVAFAAETPSARDFRLTNEALLGALTDDNSESIASLQAGLGTFDGGPVVDKDWPTPNALRDLPGGGELSHLLSGILVLPGTSATRLMIPAKPNGPLYRWRNYDRVGDPDAPEQLDSLGEPFTSPESEVTDIRQFARTLFEGPTNAWEQYFPTRILLDVLTFLGGARSGELSAAAHENGPARRPYLEILAGEGGANSVGLAPLQPGVEPRRRVTLPGYGHLDVATAALRQNDGKPERSSASLTKFVLEVSRRARRR